jgi:hypothetical protein
MGRHDRRHSPKMKQRKQQKKCKERLARRHPGKVAAKKKAAPAKS